MASRAKSLGAIILTVVLLLVVVFVIGVWRDWWEFAVDTNGPDDNVEMEMSVDEERIREDAGAVADQARETAENVTVAADLETVRGRVLEFDATEDELIIETEERTMSFKTSEATDVSGDEAVSLGELPAGEQVLVTYRSRDGVNTALEVQVAE